MQVLNVLFLFSRLFFIRSQNFRRQVDWCEPSRNEAPTGHNNTILLISLPCARFLPHAGSIYNKRILQVLICKQLTIPIQGCNLKQLYKIASYKPLLFFTLEKKPQRHQIQREPLFTLAVVYLTSPSSNHGNSPSRTLSLFCFSYRN